MKLLLAQKIFVKKTHGEVLEESPFFPPESIQILLQLIMSILITKLRSEITYITFFCINTF